MTSDSPRALPRFTPVRTFLCLLSLFAANLSWSADDAKKSFDIPADQAARSLKAFAQQAGVEVLIQADLGRNTRTPAVKGEMTAKEAASALLADTGLVADHDTKTGVFAVRKETPVEEKNGASRPASDRAADEKIEGVIKLDTFEVMGTKLLNMDIPRSRDDVQPYLVFQRDALDRSPVANLEEFLKTRLPMNTVQGPVSDLSTTSGNQSSVNLRGLGTNQTLILVDGRRMVNGSLGVNFQQPDINGIPLSAIERIEVLPSTASGIYGGGATGGVINIILRRNYSGAELTATYGNTFDTDAASLRVDLSAGFTLNNGRTRVLVTGSYSGSNQLNVGDRDFTKRARALQLANNPSALIGTTTPPLGYTANVRSQNGSNLVLKNGTALNSPITSVPVGYSGPASDGGGALIANAGQYDLGLPETTLGAQSGLTINPEVKSGLINLRHEFSNRLEVFVDASRMQNVGRSMAGVIPNSVVLPADAPNNPFTSAVRVRYSAPGLNRPIVSKSDTVRLTGGFIVRLPHDWTAAVDYVWGRSRTAYSLTTRIVGDPDGAGPGISVDSALANGTLNVMRDLNALPLDWAPYLLPSPNNFAGPYNSIMRDATLSISGPTVELAGGPLKLSGLVEHRDEKAQEAFEDTMDTNAVYSTTYRPGRSQAIASYYLEAKVPLISERQGLHRYGRSLDLQAAVRHDEYKTTASSPSPVLGLGSRNSPLPPQTYNTNRVEATKYTLGIKYAPTQDVIFRASYGTGFLPPSIGQIVPTAPLAVASQTLVDPKRGGVSSTIGPFTRTGGGNPNLRPEDSTSLSIGTILTPRFLPHLRLSIDYTRIEKHNEIASLDVQQTLILEDLLPGRVNRDPLGDADRALGYSGGVITAIDISSVNLAVRKLEAMDIQADYKWPTSGWGEFNAHMAVTWQPRFERQVTPYSTFIDFVGYVSALSQGTLEWRGNVELTWERGPWSFGWSMQYFDDYSPNSPGSTAAVIANTTLNQGSDRIPSQQYHDTFVRYRFGSAKDSWKGLFAQSDVAIGVQNVFDKSPPILSTTGTTRGYSTYGDPRLRRYTLTVRKQF